MNQTITTITRKAKAMCTKKNATKLVAVLLIAGGVTGGLAWHGHQQRVQAHEELMAAKSQMVQAQAQANNITLKTESEAIDAALQATGADASTISVKRTGLVDLANRDWKDDHHKDGKDDHDKHKKHDAHEAQKQDKHDQEDRPQGQKEPSQPGVEGVGVPSQDTQMMAPGQMPPDANGQNQGQAAQVPQNQAGMAEKPFKPVYMIELSSNSANYRVMVDAITGQVLKSDVQ